MRFVTAHSEKHRLKPVPNQLQTVEFDSPVGSWRLHAWVPSPDLAPAVEQLWSVDSSTREFQEKVLPRRTVELMINLGEAHEIVREGGGAERYRRAWVSGLQTACLHIHSRTAAQLIAASLRPAYAGLVAGAQAEELAGKVQEWDASPLRTLRERLLNTPGIAARFELLENYLRGRLNRARPLDPGLAWAADQLASSAGEIRVGALNGCMGLSRRQFIERFRRQVGFSPKLFARILRFDRAVAEVRTMSRVAWTEIAYRCGYYDQAHFNRDFRLFTGATPGEFLASRDPSGQAMLVD